MADTLDEQEWKDLTDVAYRRADDQMRRRRRAAVLAFVALGVAVVACLVAALVPMLGVVR